MSTTGDTIEGPKAEFNRVVGLVIEDRRRFVREAAIALASAPFHYHLGNGEFHIANRSPEDAVRDAIALWNELQKAGV